MIKPWSNNFPKQAQNIKSLLPSETSMASSKPVSLVSGDPPTLGDACSFSSALISGVWKKKGALNLGQKCLNWCHNDIKTLPLFYALLEDFSIVIYFFYSKTKP